MNKTETQTCFQRQIGTSLVMVRCGTDLDAQAASLLEEVARHHQEGFGLPDGALIEKDGMPFKLRHLAGEVVVCGPDFNGSNLADSPEGADQTLRILYEREALTSLVAVEPLGVAFDSLVDVEKASIGARDVILNREEPSGDGDSGWRMMCSGTESYQRRGEHVLVSVLRVLRWRRIVGSIVALPPGYRVGLHDGEISEIQTPTGEQIWWSDRTTIATNASQALRELRQAEVERLARMLIESVTGVIDAYRTVRRIVRCRTPGLWVAYANAVAALAIREWQIESLSPEAGIDDTAAMRVFVTDLRSALSKGGGLADAPAPRKIVEYSLALLRLNLPKPAARVVEGLLAAPSEHQGFLLLQRAALAHDRGDRSAAVDALRSVLAIERRCATAWYLLGRALLDEQLFDNPSRTYSVDVAEMMGAFDEALNLVQAAGVGELNEWARELAPATRMHVAWTAADLHRDRVLAFDLLGRTGESLEAAERLVAVEPEVSSSWASLGMAFTKLGRLDEALRAYGEATDRAQVERAASSEDSFLQGAMARLWYERAAVKALLGRRDDALVDVRRAIGLAPGLMENALHDSRFQGLAAEVKLMGPDVDVQSD